MTYRIEKIKKSNKELFDIFAKWDLDPEIRPFIMPRMTTAEAEIYSGEELMASAVKNEYKEIYVLFDGDQPVGTSTIDKKFFMLKHNTEDTAWISILIGNKSYWGKGLSKIMMDHLEKEASVMGFNFIELGVFEFNKKAQGLYKRMGYDILCEIKDFTYHEGKWYKDIRMIKELK